MPELAVVIPVRNEADNIAPLVAEIRAALAGRIPYEIVYVDDGSSDDTVQRIRALQATVPELRVVRHRASCGQSAAVRTGVRAARAPWIATLDGDGQNDPADIPGLWAMATGPDAPPGLGLVAGRRTKRRDTAAKRWASRIANGIRSRLLGDDTPDTGCGLKLFRRDEFLDLPGFDHMHRFLPALFIRRGQKVVSVPVNHRPRTQGRSNYGNLDRLLVSFGDLVGVMWLMRRGKRPDILPDDIHPGDILPESE
ncbi:dolichol-phosphate mannosyltransferase [Stella humosa]|uniref:Dolichol-phosphate mannosyltransferase n=1 Tax=Stella humosa TaxID=94 RepID=A0A3N1KPZ3_9PROT|nr:glycosyltransferase family 2 protein [Stella humosa]ROP80859.1 dolichol-phosphate mannosyltransferase [Stella humosa]BBK33348.1 dolichol-phosphate mannosyltransferase [Stella humosa]